MRTTGHVDRRVMCGWRTVSSQDGLTASIDIHNQMIHGLIPWPVDHLPRVGDNLEASHASW